MKILKVIKNRVTLRDILDMFLLPIILLINIFVRSDLKKKEIYIISEDPNEACDNGYIFYKYLRENKPNINAYYVINKKSKDYKKVEKYKTVINHKSIKHYLYYINAKVIITSQDHSNPNQLLFLILHRYNILKTPRVFLQHGITRNNTKARYYEKVKYRLFITGAKKEYEYIRDNFHYPKKNIVLTGFARFDILNLKNDLKNKEILIMPTWRRWFNNKEAIEEYITAYNELLNDNRFINYLKDNHLKVNFVLHKNMSKYKDSITTYSKNIKIYNNKDIDIQELMNRANLFVTDYSSLACDFGYRKVPVIYYEFDKEKYDKYHYEVGYFEEPKHGFGEVFDNKKDVIDKIIYYNENKYKIEKLYLDRMNEFFKTRDKNNCKRILEEIRKI